MVRAFAIRIPSVAYRTNDGIVQCVRQGRDGRWAAGKSEVIVHPTDLGQTGYRLGASFVRCVPLTSLHVGTGRRRCVTYVWRATCIDVGGRIDHPNGGCMAAPSRRFTSRHVRLRNWPRVRPFD